MVISYKISPLTYAYVRRRNQSATCGAAEYIARKRRRARAAARPRHPKKLAAAVAEWYESPQDTTDLKQDFHNLHLLLKKDTAALAAQAVLAEAGVVQAV